VLAGTVWVASVVQTLVDHGDNPRFLVPLQAVVFLPLIRLRWPWAKAPEPEAEP
jgi:hypothetical protein